MMNRKVFVTFFSILTVFSFAFMSCATKKSEDSSKELVNESDEKSGESKTDSKKQDESSTLKSKTAKELKKDDKAQKKAEKKQEKNATVEAVGIGVSGWVAPSLKNRGVDMIFGSVHMKSKSSLGNFSLSVYDDYKGKSIPVLSTANESINSGYTLKTGNKIIRLNDDTSVKTSSWRNGDEMNVGYRIENVADVIVNFKCYQSTPESNVDIVKMTATITNMDIKKSDYALKLVLDTILGETDRHHFYTEKNEPIKNEVLLRDFAENRYIVSKNNRASLQIFFDGADITPPELVAIANYSTVNVQNWEPDLLSYRTFDTVLAYSDSAVNITWPKRRLGPGEQCSTVTYLAFAVGDNKPTGHELIFSDYDFSVSNVGNHEVYEEEYGFRAEPSLTTEQLSDSYIQKLIERISSLEENDTNVNRDELLRLNAELDAILEALRM